MNVMEAAAHLDKSQYREEGSPELFEKMKAAGLVAVFGASDDLMEFRGAIYDEIDAYNGGRAYITPNGLLSNDCESDECPHYKKLRDQAETIEALWCPDLEDVSVSWMFKTNIPHQTFEVYEDDELHCIGIVFDLSSV